MENLRDTLINIIKEQDEALTNFRKTDSYYNWWQDEMEKNQQLQNEIRRLMEEMKVAKNADQEQEDGESNE